MGSPGIARFSRLVRLCPQVSIDIVVVGFTVEGGSCRACLAEPSVEAPHCRCVRLRPINQGMGSFVNTRLADTCREPSSGLGGQ